MNEENTPSEYFKSYIQVAVDAVMKDLGQTAFGAGIVYISLSAPDNITPRNDTYEKWVNDWDNVSKTLNETLLKIHELHNRMDGVIHELESKSLQWVVNPMATQTAS